MSYRGILTSLFLCVAMAAGGCSKTDDAPKGAEAPMMGAGLSGREAAGELWVKLAAYKDSYLASWSDGAFDNAKPRAITVLKAFSQVASKVTGPDGFWRDQVPNELLACHSNPDDQVCEGLEQAATDFAEWDELVSDIERLDASRADVFLARNGARMARYLDTFVPAEANADAMKRTAFFDQKLKKYVAKQ